MKYDEDPAAPSEPFSDILDPSVKLSIEAKLLGKPER